MGQVTPITTNIEQNTGVALITDPENKIDTLAINANKKSVFGTPQTERNFEANIPKLCFFTLVIGLGNI
jgi:hypothetical protein